MIIGKPPFYAYVTFCFIGKPPFYAYVTFCFIGKVQTYFLRVRYFSFYYQVREVDGYKLKKLSNLLRVINYSVNNFK